MVTGLKARSRDSVAWFSRCSVIVAQRPSPLLPECDLLGQDQHTGTPLLLTLADASFRMSAEEPEMILEFMELSTARCRRDRRRINLGEVKQKYGDRIFITGGIDVSYLMACADPDEVRKACREAIAAASPGYFIGSTTEPDNGSKPKNILAMIEAANPNIIVSLAPTDTHAEESRGPNDRHSVACIAATALLLILRATANGGGIVRAGFPKTVFYVAPDGSDAWSGSSLLPLAAKRRTFATPVRAVQAVRALLHQGMTLTGIRIPERRHLTS